MGNSLIAFVQSPEIGEIQGIKGVSHASWTAAPVAAGVMQHIALNVDTEADLMAIRDRLRSHGCWVMGPLDHGFCKSIYLAAPEGIMLELATSEGKPIDAEAWIDPEVVRLAGISPSDLRRYKNPPEFESARRYPSQSGHRRAPDGVSAGAMGEAQADDGRGGHGHDERADPACQTQALSREGARCATPSARYLTRPPVRGEALRVGKLSG